ncbi:MAG: hypothetical protein HY900_11195 [Deltaproteobacteria bacterium]|nr:hypothetical protein [Deltaproteobacteria bacterium]
MNSIVFSPGLNFVFGLAIPRLRRCVVSLHRLVHPDRSVYLRRALTEAVHELGNLLLLAHCANPACVMHCFRSPRGLSSM